MPGVDARVDDYLVSLPIYGRNTPVICSENPESTAATELGENE